MNIPKSVLPTGTCFDDVLQWYAQEWHQLPAAFQRGYYFVHGICVGITGPEDPKQYCHAWILHPSSSKVIDFGLHDETKEKLLLEIDAPEFYAHRRVKEQVAYNPKDYLNALRLSDNSGPWRANIFRLCKDIRVRDGRVHLDPDLAIYGHFQKLKPGSYSPPP